MIYSNGAYVIDVRLTLQFLILFCGTTSLAAAQEGYLHAFRTRKATAAVQADTILLQNAVLAARWSTKGGKTARHFLGRFFLNFPDIFS